MTRLDICDSCGGFLPARWQGRPTSSCPHCAGSVRRALGRRLGAGALGGGVIAFTLMACYGVPVCDDSGGECTSGDAAATGDGTAHDGKPDVHVLPGDAGTDAGGDADAADADDADDSG